ncbi:MAG: aldolase/citrate lyase family protein [Pseudomonadota bacterium]
MRENTALSAWRRGEQTIGCWLSLGCVHSAEMMANAGFDWICVDMQHGILDYTDLTRMLPAISTTDTIPIVRVPWNEPYEIMKALDIGAYGVIVPMVNNRTEAEQAVAACRYPPDGMRSFGPIRAALYGGQGYATEANEHVAVIAMIETPDGIENVEEIVTTPGLDAVYIGPADLALAMGLPVSGDQPQEEHLEMVKHIRDVCRKHNVAIGIHTGSLKYTQKYLELGMNFVTLGSDSGFMARGAFKELAEARGTQEKQRESTGY